MAVRIGDLRDVELLFLEGADISYCDQYGLTALHAAAIKGHKEVVQMLVEVGLDLESRDGEGHAPLHLAVVGGNLETVEMLIQNGANVNAKSKSGATPLYMATAMGMMISLSLLSAEAAEIEKKKLGDGGAGKPRRRLTVKKIQKREKRGIKDSGSTQGNKDIELKKKKKKKRGEKPYPTLFFTRRWISPENEEHSEAALNLIFIQLGCMCDIWTEFCRVEEEKEFGGGLAAWGGRNLAECGGEDGCGGEREEEERETG
ncbi:hypothetical protein ACLB2K_074827 [Fragaria x ananassa]